MKEGWLDDLLGVRRVLSEDGSELPERATLAFEGDFTVTDDPTRQATVIHVEAPSSGTSTAVGLFRVRLATTAPVPLSGLIDVDGVASQEGNRILVRANVDAAENGVWLASAVGWTRATDADEGTELVGASLVGVAEGDVYGGKVFILTGPDPAVIGTSPLTFQLLGSDDAASLAGIPVYPGTPVDRSALLYHADLGRWLGDLIRNENVAADAALAVTKLAPGAAGQVVRTGSGGAIAWSSISAGDVVEAFVNVAVQADQDNFSPASWDTATIVSLNSNGVWQIRGLGPARVRRKTLVVPNDEFGSTGVVLMHAAGGQAAGNQIYTPSHQPYRLRPGESVEVFCPGSGWGWYVLGTERTPSAAKRVLVPLGAMRPCNTTAWDDWLLKDQDTGLVWERKAGGAGQLKVSLEVPTGTRLRGVRAAVAIPTNAFAQLHLYKDVVDQTIAPLTAGRTELQQDTFSVGADGWILNAAPFTPEVVDRAAATYYALIYTASAALMRVYWVDYEIEPLGSYSW